MSSLRSMPHPPPFPTRALALLVVSIVVVACSPGEDTVASDMATLQWNSACLELWAGGDLIATSSVNRAHDGEWYEPRGADYFCEMAMPIPPTITLPALPTGEYELCDQGHVDCKPISVSSGLSTNGLQLLLEKEE